MDPDGFNPRSHERGIDGSTTPETSLTRFLKLPDGQLCPFLNSAGVKDSNNFKKNLIKAIITKKKIQDPLLPQNTKDDEKKSSKYKNIE